MLRPILSTFLLIFAFFATQPAAQAGPLPTPTPSASAPAPPEEKIDSDSPRASMTEFFAACNRGDFARAADYLELLPSEVASGPELARKLKAVLDRRLSIDPETLSPDSGGNRSDGLANTDELGKIPVRGDKFEPVRILRRQRANADVWIFSHATVLRVDAWFDALPHRWMLDNLPEPLLRPGPRDLLRWQWIAMPLLAIVSLFLGILAARVLVRLMRAIAEKTPATWDDAIVPRLRSPLSIIIGAGISYVALPALGLYARAQDFITGMLRTTVFVAFFWSLLRSIDVFSDIIKMSPWGKSHHGSRAMISLGARIIKAAFGFLAAVAIISELGYPVASLIAGLGIGGLALALASQKTVENLFGAFSLGVDQPFREGDFVKVDNIMGTVEAIGLRSTRLRTPDRTLVSIPNGKLAEMRIETFAVRDRIRFACTLGLVYGTTASQMRLVVAGLEQVLREHPKVWKDNVTVRFKELTPTSLDIEVEAWFVTPDWAEFQLIRQDTLLAFLDVVEKAGTAFAFPTRTVHVVGAGAASGRA
jgi:MscS family membrane protein